MGDERIPDSVLDDIFNDGDDWNAILLNKIVAILKSGINQNFKDIKEIELLPGPAGPTGPMPDASDIVMSSGRTLQEEIDNIYAQLS